MVEKKDWVPSYGPVLFIGSSVVGSGEDYGLGSLLMQKFLHEVGGHRYKPEAIIFMNEGVKLVIEGSLSLGELKQLENQGVEILVCGTCLSRFRLTDKVAVGKVSNMSDVTDILLKSSKVTSL
ncbi:DsrE family protein [Chloroflexota bacterium]